MLLPNLLKLIFSHTTIFFGAGMYYLKKLQQLELKYENIIILVGMFIVAYMFVTPSIAQQIKSFIINIGELRYLGALIAGTFFSWGLTTAPAAAALWILGKTANPFAIAAIGSVGATAMDLIIFRFVKRKFGSDVARLERRQKKLSKWIHRFGPLIAGFMIASPLPDEIAAGFLGAIRFEEKKFIIFIYFAHFIGILAISGVAALI